jgi:Tfp pilus assembly protein PilN
MMTLLKTAVGASVLLLALSGQALAQESEQELRDEIEALKKGQESLQKEVQEIKRLLQARPARPSGPNVQNVVFNIRDNPVHGERTAKLTLIEFADYQ